MAKGATCYDGKLKVAGFYRQIPAGTSSQWPGSCEETPRNSGKLDKPPTLVEYATLPEGIGIYTTYSLSLGRVASELASLRGGVRWGNLPKSSDICHRSPLLAGARLSPGRANFLCRSCVDTNGL